MMKEYLHSAPDEKYLDHINLCLENFELLYPLFESTIQRLLNYKDAKKNLKSMIIYHDLGKLTKRWQDNVNKEMKEKEKVYKPSHASIGAAYLWKILPDGIKEPIAFAIAIHHTDRGLLGDNIEKPDEQAITDGVVDYRSGKIIWFDKEKKESLPEELFPKELENFSVNELKEMARGLRSWARGCPIYEQHNRRIKVTMIHHILKLCDISAASKRKKWEEETEEKYAGRLVEEINDYIEKVNIRMRSLALNAELARCISLLKEKYKPQKIILFGSLATNEIGKWSDIDLVIVKDTKKPFLERTKELLLFIHPKVGMDILVYTPEEFEKISCRNFFEKEILSKGVIL